MEKGRLGSGNTLSFRKVRRTLRARRIAEQFFGFRVVRQDHEEEKGGISRPSIYRGLSDPGEEKNSAGILRPDNRKPPSSPDGLSGQRRFLMKSSRPRGSSKPPSSPDGLSGQRRFLMKSSRPQGSSNLSDHKPFFLIRRSLLLVIRSAPHQYKQASVRVWRSQVQRSNILNTNGIHRRK